ncbi:TolC family outer membrane protein [Salinisphaera sp. G21_0]|uniref:TolC family outer membrane protein n=1 Tax=Salinisphaera sp. G21_0 TaxID=2821094 RepID=UPI001ADBF71B|nr:TolC family outer membrane protein [Salinisphaera sp. G21_0]MBO9481008.1 TolC family outer membrane protein [Salinisphaera sp. G21_0]
MSPLKEGVVNMSPGIKATSLKRFILTVSWLTVVPLYSQAADLLDVYKQALDHDPVYRAGMFEHEASKEIYTQARAVLLPSLQFEYSKTKSKQDIVSSDNTVYAKGSTSFPTDEQNLSLTQSIYSYSNWAYFKQAKAEVRKVAADLENVRQDLVMRVAAAYFTVLRESDSYQAIDAEVKALEKHFQLVDREFANGLANSTDLLDAEARYMQAQAGQIEIANNLHDALQGLKEISGKLPDNLNALGQNLALQRPDPSTMKSWVDNAQANNPAVLSRQSAVDVAWQEVRRQKGGHYPTFDLVVTQSARETGGSLFGGGSEVDSRDVLFQMTLPIYSGGAVSSKVRESINRHYKAQDELELALRQVAREAQAAYTGIVSSISKVNALQKSVETYEKAAEGKRTAFESGVISSGSVLDSERLLFIARSDFSAARYDYLMNHLRLKRAAGSLSEADIVGINRLLNGVSLSTDTNALLAFGG